MNSSVNSTSEENKKIGNLEDRLVKTSRTKTKEGWGWGGSKNKRRAFEGCIKWSNIHIVGTPKGT